MAKYKVKPTYPVEVKNPETGKTEIEQRPYDEKKIQKYHGGKLLKVGDVVELTEEQLEIHGEHFFVLVPSESEEVTKTSTKTRKEKSSVTRT